MWADACCNFKGRLQEGGSTWNSWFLSLSMFKCGLMAFWLSLNMLTYLSLSARAAPSRISWSLSDAPLTGKSTSKTCEAKMRTCQVKVPVRCAC